MDAEGNGVQDYNDYGIGGVMLQLTDSTGAVVATTMTDSNGLYLFSELCEGDYCVEVMMNYQLSTLEPTGPRRSISCTSVDGTNSDYSKYFAFCVCMCVSTCLILHHVRCDE